MVPCQRVQPDLVDVFQTQTSFRVWSQTENMQDAQRTDPSPIENIFVFCVLIVFLGAYVRLECRMVYRTRRVLNRQIAVIILLRGHSLERTEKYDPWFLLRALLNHLAILTDPSVRFRCIKNLAYA